MDSSEKKRHEIGSRPWTTGDHNLAGTHGWSVRASWDACKELRWAELCKSPPPPCSSRSFTSIQMPCKSRSFTSIQMFHTHTHTLPREGGKIKVRTVKWRRWKWDESYLTRTRRGERKRRGEGENTNTGHLAQCGQTLKRQGKRKAEADGHGTRPAEGGEGRKRLNQPTTAKPTPT